MPPVKVVAVAGDMVTAYGRGIRHCWNGLLSGRSAVGPLDRFPTDSFRSSVAALVPDLDPASPDSRVMQMVTGLFRRHPDVTPDTTAVVLATTTGEIEFLEDYLLGGGAEPSASRPDRLLARICRRSGLRPGWVVSAACASSSVAVAQAAAGIRRGETDCMLVVACDSVSEFVYAGFSSLTALAEAEARPFDRDRDGLSLGEAAAFMLLMSEQRALKEGRPILGEVSGWGMTADAYHMTGPSRDGKQLAAAVRKALEASRLPAEAVGCLSAHGTGTVYNDAMEMQAFKAVFAHPVPVYSIKGGTGHTMGAAGLTEILLGFESLKMRMAPPTVNTHHVDPAAAGWVHQDARKFEEPVTVSTNSGFGGINCAVVLKRYSDGSRIHE